MTVYCQKELGNILKNMGSMLKHKENNQDLLHVNIQSKVAEYESAKLEMDITYKEDREILQSSSALLSCDQRAAAAVAHCTSEFCSHMFDEFQLFLRRQAGLEKKEDVLSLKRNEKQQELEVIHVEFAVDNLYLLCIMQQDNISSRITLDICCFSITTIVFGNCTVSGAKS